MPRPRKCCAVHALPDVTYYKPRGIPMRQLKENILTLEGFEAIRLADHQGLDHQQAAKQMQVSRATFGRILSQARHAVAQALVHGMALRIQGGNYEVNRRCFRGSGQNQACKPQRPLCPLAQNREEKIMTKIAISSEGPSLDDLLDPRFGRAAGFVIIDPDSGEHSYVENGQAQTMAQGAGIQAAETVVNAGARAVLTGSVGPKAYLALNAAGVQVSEDMGNMTVKQAFERYRQGQVQWASGPNSQGKGR